MPGDQGPSVTFHPDPVQSGQPAKMTGEHFAPSTEYRVTLGFADGSGESFSVSTNPQGAFVEHFTVPSAGTNTFEVGPSADGSFLSV